MKPLPVNQILDPAKIRAIRVQAELVREGKLGYLALLRNVRNLLTHAPEVVT